MSEKNTYQGLDWIVDPLGRRQLVALSPTTQMRYAVDYEIENQCVAYSVIAPTEVIDLAQDENPAARLGVFPGLDAAIYTAERHDFAFFKSLIERRGEDAVFRGSDRIVALVAAIATGEEDPGDFVPGDYICPNGRSFSRAASFFAAKKMALKQNTDGSWTMSLNLEAGEMPLWLHESSPGALLVIGAVATGTEEDPEGKATKKRGADALKRMILMEDEPDFQVWLGSRYDRWGLIATAMQVDSRAVAIAVQETLKRLLGIPTRADLRRSRDAVDKLERYDHEYYRDMSRGFGSYQPYTAD
jgi:hypothetical protein